MSSIKSRQKNKNMIQEKGSYGRMCRANNERKITCPAGSHQVRVRDFLPSMGMCTDCYLIYSEDMNRLAEERDEARSEHEEYITATT
jgi:hypothetical protein